MQCSCSRLKCTHLFHSYWCCILNSCRWPKLLEKLEHKLQWKYRSIKSNQFCLGCHRKFTPPKKNPAIFLNPPKLLCVLPYAVKKTEALFGYFEEMRAPTVPVEGAVLNLKIYQSHFIWTKFQFSWVGDLNIGWEISIIWIALGVFRHKWVCPQIH